MQKHILPAAALAIAGFSAPMSASAAVVQAFTPTSSAFASTLSSPGGASIQIVNGVVDPFTQNAGALTTSSSPDGFTNSASASQTTGTVATATADLQNGALHALAGPSLNSPSATFARAEFLDGVYFNNTTNGNLQLDISLALDGVISGVPGFSAFSGGFTTLNLLSCPLCGNGTGSFISFLDGSIATLQAVAMFSGNGVYSIANFGNQLLPTDPYSAITSFNAATGSLSALISTSLLIPPGQTAIGIGSVLDLDCRAQGALCDFSNTGKIAFGTLPTGLSFTSASGVFLTGGGPTPIETPLPAAALLMAPGLGALGALARRKRRKVQQTRPIA